MLPPTAEAFVRDSLIQRDSIPDGGAVEVDMDVDGAPESVVLLRRGAEVAAFLNVCPHAGRRLDFAPGRFLFDQGRLVCAAHGASFEALSGLCVGGPCRGQSLRAVPVAVDADGAVRPA